MLDKLKQKITEKQKLNGNRCGTTPNTLMIELGVEYAELIKLLNQLYVEKFITIKEGINNKLIFLRNGK